MILKQILKPGALALMLLMLATRFDHFGTPFSLPDASLTVFFLTGLWLGGGYLFLALLLEAGLIDYFAITHLGVSDFCVSNAYVFLVPTYGVMWLAGKFCRQYTSLSLSGAAQQFSVVFLATTSAFLISNSSFFVFSSQVANPTWAQYFQGIVSYYPPYLLSTLTYTVLIFSLVTAVKSLGAFKSSQQIT
jgi:hypothetical protein